MTTCLVRLRTLQDHADISQSSLSKLLRCELLLKSERPCVRGTGTSACLASVACPLHVLSRVVTTLPYSHYSGAFYKLYPYSSFSNFGVKHTMLLWEESKKYFGKVRGDDAYPSSFLLTKCCIFLGVSHLMSCINTLTQS